MDRRTKLEDIGFYTLSDARAARTSSTARLERCELLLTNECNFACAYCRRTGPESLSWRDAQAVVDYWLGERCRCYRFSGGEPTCWPWLIDLVEYVRAGKWTERVAVSTNGSADAEYYDRLVDAGVDDFSVSLDTCCGGTFGELTGGGDVEHVKRVVRHLARRTYVTLGVVVTPANVRHIPGVVDFAIDAGVADVRVIPAAQWRAFWYVDRVELATFDKFPIFSYRWSNMLSKPLRGLTDDDCGVCRLALDDMAADGAHHYPCIIHMREGGQPIGQLDAANKSAVREERRQWVKHTNRWHDQICRTNCLDVCRDYNNRASELQGHEVE